MFRFGIEDLDKIFGKILPGSLIIVAGHPGAGKTTLASTICKANAIEGKKCVYFSFFEDKDKYMSYMENLGLGMKDLEEKGVFEYVKLPFTINIDSFINSISNIIREKQPKIIIIDSINALLAPIGKDEKKRAYLLNYFYELSRIINGLEILIAELPFGKESIELGAIEFIADAIFLLKHSIERGLLVRRMEIRKLRGAPLYIAEIPFSIEKGYGIITYPPIWIEQAPAEGEEIAIPTDILEKSLKGIREGNIVFVTYPSTYKSYLPLLTVLSIVIYNNWTALIFAYRHSPEALRSILKEVLSKHLALNGNKISKFMNRFKIISINPFMRSASQLYAMETQLIRKHSRERAVIYIDGWLHPLALYRQGLPLLYNELLLLKLLCKTTFILSPRVDDRITKVYEALADVVLEFQPTFERGERALLKINIYTRGGEPYSLAAEKVEDIIPQLREALKDLG